MMKKGFSLLEILVTATIIALLVVASVPSFSKLEDRQKRENAVNLIVGCLLEAKAKALAPSDQNIDSYQATVTEAGCQINSVTDGSVDSYGEYLINSGFTLKEVTTNKAEVVVNFSTDPPNAISAMAQDVGGAGLVGLSNAVFLQLTQTSTGIISTILLNLATGIVTHS